MGLTGRLTDSQLAEIRVGDYSRLSANRRVSSKSAFCMTVEVSQPLVSEQRVAADKLEGWVVCKLDPLDDFLLFSGELGVRGYHLKRGKLSCPEKVLDQHFLILQLCVLLLIVQAGSARRLRRHLL